MVEAESIETINKYKQGGMICRKDKIASPLRVLSNKTKHSFELFLDQRLSNVKFIASAYSRGELADEKNLNRIFRVLKEEFGGFVDLGLIDCKGIQISYAGPYNLLEKDYSQQSWFQEVVVRGVYISDVFMGYRKFPHIAIAVQLLTEEIGAKQLGVKRVWGTVLAENTQMLKLWRKLGFDVKRIPFESEYEMSMDPENFSI